MPPARGTGEAEGRESSLGHVDRLGLYTHLLSRGVGNSPSAGSLTAAHPPACHPHVGPVKRLEPFCVCCYFSWSYLYAGARLSGTGRQLKAFTGFSLLALASVGGMLAREPRLLCYLLLGLAFKAFVSPMSFRFTCFGPLSESCSFARLPPWALDPSRPCTGWLATWRSIRTM